MSDIDINFNSSIKLDNRFKYFTSDSFVKLIEANKFKNFSTKLLLNYLNETSVFLDIGSHHGYFSILASEKIAKQNNIYSIEPLTENTSVIKRNLEVNSLNEINILNVGITNYNGKGNFEVSETSDKGKLTLFSEEKASESREIIVHTIDYIFKEKLIDFIKISTSGNELNVLYGAVNTIKSNPNIKLLIEFSPKSLKNSIQEPLAILEYIFSIGFEIYAVDDETNKLIKINKDDPSKIYKFISTTEECNILCLRNSKHIVICLNEEKYSLETCNQYISMAKYAFQNTNNIVSFLLPFQGTLSKKLSELNLPYYVIDESLSWEKEHITDFNEFVLTKLNYFLVNKLKKVIDSNVDIVIADNINNGVAWLISSISDAILVCGMSENLEENIFSSDIKILIENYYDLLVNIEEISKTEVQVKEFLKSLENAKENILSQIGISRNVSSTLIKNYYILVLSKNNLSKVIEDLLLQTNALQDEIVAKNNEFLEVVKDKESLEIKVNSLDSSLKLLEYTLKAKEFDILSQEELINSYSTILSKRSVRLGIQIKRNIEKLNIKNVISRLKTISN